MEGDLEISEVVFDRSKRRLRKIRADGYALLVRYQRRTRRIEVQISGGLRLTLSPRMVPGLSGASVADLSRIEISVTGLGLHWPALDVDLYIPELLRGNIGARGSRTRHAVGLGRQTVQYGTVFSRLPSRRFSLGQTRDWAERRSVVVPCTARKGQVKGGSLLALNSTVPGGGLKGFQGMDPSRSTLSPPDGYSTWLDYAVDTFDTRSILLERMFDRDDLPDRETILSFARAELESLRSKVVQGRR